MTPILFIGTWKGIVSFKPGADGHWQADNEGLKNWGVFDLAVSPKMPNRIFAGTRGDGVWVSEDLGETWKRPNRGKPGPGKVRSLAIDPENPDRVYAGTEPIAIWVTEDAGANWRELRSVWDVPGIGDVGYPVYTIEPHVRDITINPRDTKTIYAALQVGYMIKTTDRGETWSLLTKGLDADVHTVVLRSDDPDHVYVATGGGDGRRGKVPGRALYASTDGGESWQPSAMEFEQTYSVPLTPHPNNPQLMFSSLATGTPSKWKNREGGAQAELIRSENGGETWQAIDTGFEAMRSEFPMAIAVDAIDNNRIYVATRYGKVFCSPDGGKAWSDLGIDIAEVTEMMALTV